ncbi:beta-glucosidase 12-like [Magnolia sinica]|uniref:beta-glucosidase 12-like n=1 Tax=Magnolia sinica TaxID=86752 RepID=UPI0026595F74|nr:beta-glucosidase 12-like [Magnolia sinica]
MEDIKIMKEVGFNSYRFSISWPRILPKGTKKGGINRDGINYYNNLINALLENGGYSTCSYTFVYASVSGLDVYGQPFWFPLLLLIILEEYGASSNLTLWLKYLVMDVIGIEPFVTIFHWDLPLELQTKLGGFLNGNIVEPFKDFADVCFQEFGDRVKHWITMNEPNIFTWLGYDLGKMPPGRCSEKCDVGDSATEPYLVAHNLILCHAATVNLYRTNYQAIQKGNIGITLASTWFEPYSSGNPYHNAFERAMDFHYGWFLEPIVFGDYPFNMRAIVRERLPTFTEEDSRMIKGSFDFIGFNYYYANYAKSVTLKNDDEPTSYTQDYYVEQLGEKDNIPIGIVQKGASQYVYPKGIKDLVLYVQSRYRNPTIYITENGFGTNNPAPEDPKVLEEDLPRQQFLADHLSELREALRMGANVKGYFLWSLTDSFEWTSGYGQRLGIYRIDRTKPSLDRIPKQSAHWFAKFLLNKF